MIRDTFSDVKDNPRDMMLSGSNQTPEGATSFPILARAVGASERDLVEAGDVDLPYTGQRGGPPPTEHFGTTIA